jgi:hypothetical protein
LYDRLGARHDVAVKALLRTPAPHLPALAFKLDLLIGEQAWEMTGGELCLAALRRDAHRFARGCSGSRGGLRPRGSMDSSLRER